MQHSESGGENERLMLHGKCLEDGHTLADYGVGPDDVFHLVLKLRVSSLISE
jgi:hypothetical protein